MSGNNDRVKFLKASKASIEQDLKSLKARGAGDGGFISNLESTLKSLDSQISSAESNKDSTMSSQDSAADDVKNYKSQIDIAAKNLDRLKKTNAPRDRLNAQLRTLDNLRKKLQAAEKRAASNKDAMIPSDKLVLRIKKAKMPISESRAFSGEVFVKGSSNIEKRYFGPSRESIIMQANSFTAGHDVEVQSDAVADDALKVQRRTVEWAEGRVKKLEPLYAAAEKKAKENSDPSWQGEKKRLFIRLSGARSDANKAKADYGRMVKEKSMASNKDSVKTDIGHRQYLQREIKSLEKNISEALRMPGNQGKIIADVLGKTLADYRDQLGKLG